MGTEMTSGVLLGMGHILTNAPYFVLACALFWRQRRYSGQATALVFSAFVLAHGGSGFLLTAFYAGNVWWPPIQFTLFCLGSLALLLWMFHITFARALYCFLLMRAVYTAILYIVLNAFMLARPGQYIGFDETPLFTLVALLATGAAFPFLLRYFTGPLRAAFSELNDKVIRQLCVPPVLFFLLDQAYSTIRNTLEYDSFQKAAIFVFMLLTGLATYYVNLRMVLDTARHTRLAAEAKMKEQALAADNAALTKMNRMRTEFIQDMSHEMKTPLTVIATGIDYADREIRKTDIDLPEAGEALNTVRDETQRLGRMISGMVDLASMEAGRNRKRVNFAALLRSSAETFRLTVKQRNITLTVDIADSLPDVFVEKDRFVQVMTNLFANAAAHTQSGRVALTADYDDPYITVRVRDTGDGVPPGLLPDVFRRGVSSRGGTGYGLYVCKAVVEAHGGTIQIENAADGAGAVVRFTVPVYGGQEAGHT